MFSSLRKFYLMKRVTLYAYVFAVMMMQSCDKDDITSGNGGKVFTANGNINAIVDQFRQELGTLNTSPGAVGGR